MRKYFIFILLLSIAHAKAQTNQEWRDSISTLLEQIRLQPKNIDLRLKKAEANINLQQWDYALDEYSRVLTLDDKNLAALYFRAYCYDKLRHYDLARADYESFIAIQPMHFEAHLGLAHCLQKQGRKQDTHDALNRLVLLFPDSAQAYAARAAYEVDQKQYEVALFDWDEAIKRKPDNVGFSVSKVEVLLRLGRRKEAREALDLLVKRGTHRGLLKQWYDQCK